MLFGPSHVDRGSLYPLGRTLKGVLNMFVLVYGFCYLMLVRTLDLLWLSIFLYTSAVTVRDIED